MEGMGAAAPAATRCCLPWQRIWPGTGIAQSQPEPINIRSDFNPLATFAPTVRTGSNGEAPVFIKLPDNLTRYRVMVVAVDDGGRQFGMGESNDHSPAAVDGPPVRASLPQLWRQIRIAGRASEPDRRAP